MSTRTTVTFDGHDLTQDYRVSDLRTPLLPVTIDTADVPGRDGLLMVGRRLAPRTVSLRLTVKGTDQVARQAAARRLAQILNVSEPRPLAISIDGGLYYMAVPNATADGQRYLNATSFEVAFEASDPVAYGATRTVTVPSGGSVTFEVGGTYPTMPRIDVPAARNGSGGFWRLLLEDGSFMTLTLPGSGTYAIAADCAERVLRVAGNVTALPPTSDWLVLEPGEHTLTMTGTGAATVAYEERWV